jgi:hypothetical protein
MVKVTRMWREKRLAREEGSKESSDDRRGEEKKMAVEC